MDSVEDWEEKRIKKKQVMVAKLTKTKHRQTATQAIIKMIVPHQHGLFDVFMGFIFNRYVSELSI